MIKLITFPRVVLRAGGGGGRGVEGVTSLQSLISYNLGDLATNFADFENDKSTILRIRGNETMPLDKISLKIVNLTMIKLKVLCFVKFITDTDSF